MSYYILDYYYLIIVLIFISVWGILHDNSVNNTPTMYKLTALGFFYNALLKFNLSVWEIEGNLLTITLIIISILFGGYLLLPNRGKYIRFEVPLLIILSALAMMIMTEASDLLIIFLALEMQAFIFYTLVGIKKESLYSIEGALKYFLIGSLASTIFILGVSYLYGFTSFTDLIIISDLIYDAKDHPYLIIGSQLLVCALLFKIGAVPFHLWLPDAYQGAPTYILIFLIVFPKIFLFYLFFLINQIFNTSNIILCSLILTTIIGSFQAVSQIKIKRFIAYTVIFNNAFFLALIILSGYLVLFSLILALLLYMCVSILTLLPLLSIRTIKNQSFSLLADFRELRKANLYLAFTISIAFFSAAGIPPFIGFFLKFFVFLALLEKSLIFLPIILILASLLPAYYYIRITAFIFFFPKSKLIFLYPMTSNLARSLSVFLSITLCFILDPSLVITFLV